VKDAQRTKTHEGTRRVLYVVWGLTGSERGARTVAWLGELLGLVDAEITPREITPPEINTDG